MVSVFSGLRVVDFCQGMAGPLAGGILADNGAEVTKVEPESGDWARNLPGFHTWNRGKKSIALNLKTEEGLRTVQALVASADVVLTSFRPGVAEELGLDGDTLSALHPSLVYGSISGFGPAGKYEHIAAYEAVVCAKTGRMMGNDALSGAVVPDADERPIYIASPISAYGAAMLTLQGVAASLLAREKTGRGRAFKTSLLEGLLASSMRMHLTRTGDQLRELDKKDDLILKGINLSFMTAECKDGRYIQMCARQDKHYHAWLATLGLHDLAKNPRFSGGPLSFKAQEDIDELDAILRQKMKERTQEEWMQLFIQNDVGADPFLTFEEFLNHSEMLANDRVAEIEDPDLGRVKQMGALAAFSETPSLIQMPAPRLDQHRNDILAGLVPATPQPVAKASKPERLPLEGYTVLEFATFIAGPLAGTLLAELGARVIKVEPLEGDAIRRVGVEFCHLSISKESIALNLKDPASKEIVRKLVEQSDAVFQNFRPAAAKKLGIDDKSLRQYRPDLVYVNAASYGSRGAQAQRAAFHSTPHALSGAGIVQAGQGNAPVDDSYPDPCAASAVAAALIMGLFARERYGKGQFIETTMLTSTGYVHSNDLTLYKDRPDHQVPDADQQGPNALYRLYPCQSGWVFLAVVSDMEWQKLASAVKPDWLRDERLATSVGRLAHDGLIAETLRQFFASQDANHWEAFMGSHQVPCVSAADGLIGKFLVKEGLVRPVEYPGFEDFWGYRGRIRFAGTPDRLGKPCRLGEQTDDILAGCGYSKEERCQFYAAGVAQPFKEKQ